MKNAITELVDLRKKKRFSQCEFADKCNLTRQYIWQIESGTYRPSIDVMITIATVLGVKPMTIIKMFTKKK